MMAAFWFVVGTLVAAAAFFLAVRKPAWQWWHWILFILLGAWCVFGLDLAVTTYVEGNAKGGNIFLIVALVTDLIGFLIVRALVRVGWPKASAKAAVAK